MKSGVSRNVPSYLNISVICHIFSREPPGYILNYSILVPNYFTHGTLFPR